MIQFLYPWFLWALLALLIPIIIHLFHFRRYRKVYFTNVRLLREVKEQTSQRARLRHLLILLSRLILLALLVFAFAQPFIAAREDVQQGARSVSIYIDNSFSMQGEGRDLTLFEQARFKALEIVDAYEPEDEFQILTNRFGVIGQRWYNRDDAREVINQLEIEPFSRTINEVWERQMQALYRSGTEIREAYVLSDFQATDTELPAITDSTINVHWIPLQPVRQRNVSIDSVWFESPVMVANQVNPIIIQMSNRGVDLADDIRLSLRLGENTIPVGTISIDGLSTVTDTVQLQIGDPGLYSGIAGITDYPVQFDDTYYFSFSVPEYIRVLHITDPGGNADSWRAMFAGAPYFQLTEEPSDRIDFSRFPNYQLIAIDQLREISSGLITALSSYVQSGGNLVLFPGKTSVQSSYNQLLAATGGNALGSFSPGNFSIADINKEAFVFREVFDDSRQALQLPSATGKWDIRRTQTAATEALLRFRDGSTALEQFEYERGYVFLSALPPDPEVSEWKRQGDIFIPMIYRMALLSRGVQKPAYTLGEDRVIELEAPFDRERPVYRMVSAEGEFIPGQRGIGAITLLDVYDQISRAGIYNIQDQSDRVLAKAAFNYSRAESVMEFIPVSVLRAHAASMPQLEVLESAAEQNLQILIAERSRGVPLWRWFLLGALMFLLIESLLIRFWKS